MDDLPNLKMVVFHSYVGLPEGNGLISVPEIATDWWLAMLHSELENEP